MGLQKSGWLHVWSRAWPGGKGASARDQTCSSSVLRCSIAPCFLRSAGSCISSRATSCVTKLRGTGGWGQVFQRQHEPYRCFVVHLSSRLRLAEERQLTWQAVAIAISPHEPHDEAGLAIGLTQWQVRSPLQANLVKFGSSSGLSWVGYLCGMRPLLLLGFGRAHAPVVILHHSQRRDQRWRWCLGDFCFFLRRVGQVKHCSSCSCSLFRAPPFDVRNARNNETKESRDAFPILHVRLIKSSQGARE